VLSRLCDKSLKESRLLIKKALELRIDFFEAVCGIGRTARIRSGQP